MRYYQELIGVLRWAVELGRIDIAMEVSMLSTHLASVAKEGTLTTGISHVRIFESKTQEDVDL